MLDPEMNHLEFGIDPDVKVDMTSEDIAQGKDTMIETACRVLNSPMLDPEMNHLEFGIDPDVKVDMTSEDIAQGKDTMIETACRVLKGQ